MKLTAGHLKRYKEIAGLLWRYGRSDLVRPLDAATEVETDAREAPDGRPEQLAADLEAMGPTYVKLGQLLASRPDLLPEPYLRALARLQNDVKPIPYEEVERIVGEELGIRISKAFSRFEAQPLAAASLGQVHAAALRDGREVVVKVQRPNIRAQIEDDFEVLEQIAGFLDAHTDVGRRYRFSAILDQLHRTLRDELDYEREAQNLVAFGRNLRSFTRICVPQPVPAYSKRSVLTMDQVRGRKITAVGPLGRLDIDGEPLADELFRAYLQQVLVDGLFHADPHPGNVFLTDDHRIALLDLGMVGHTAPEMQEHLLKLLLAISEGQSGIAAELVVRISEAREDADPAELRRLVGELLAPRGEQGPLQHIDVGKSLLTVTRHAADNGYFVPAELTMLGKTLLQLEEIGKILAPEFDPTAAVRRDAGKLISQRMRKGATRGSLFSPLLEMRGLLSRLPSRLNRIVDAVANNELEVKVRAVDAKLVMEGFQKIANRITSGIVLGALILGASLLMRVDTPFRILGYPGLAMLCFLAATAGGAWLLVSIFVQDQKKTRSK